jgi:hypothetical protein
MSHDLVAMRGAGFGPDQLKAMIQAFDRAWDTMAPNFEPDSLLAQAYRLKLANAIVELAIEHNRC